MVNKFGASTMVIIAGLIWTAVGMVSGVKIVFWSGFVLTTLGLIGSGLWLDETDDGPPGPDDLE